MGNEPRPGYFSGEQIKWRPKLKKKISPNSGKDKKKKVFTKNGTLFFLKFKWRSALGCTTELNYWRGCRWRPYSNYWGDISSPSLPGFGTPATSFSPTNLFDLVILYLLFSHKSPGKLSPQLHAKWLHPSTQVPPFWQGFESHIGTGSEWITTHEIWASKDFSLEHCPIFYSFCLQI